MGTTTLPEPVQQVVDRLDAAFDAASEPSVAYRRELHAVIEAASAALHPRAAYYRRVKWGIACAYRTLPLWERVAGPDDPCRAMLGRAISALRGTGTLEEFAEANERLFVQLLDRSNQEPALQILVSAGFSAYAAIKWVVYDLDPLTLELPTGELDPAEWEPAIYSAIAHAGGTAALGEGDARLRREFWQWYVHEALVAVWDPLTQPGELAAPKR